MLSLPVAGDHLQVLTQDQVAATPGSQPGRKRILKRRHHNRGDKSPGLKRTGDSSQLALPQTAAMNGEHGNELLSTWCVSRVGAIKL